MEIKSVYYEELKSKCVNSKWESTRIGAEVSVGKEDSLIESMNYAKSFVKDRFSTYFESNEDNKTKDILRQINKEVISLLTQL